MYSNIFQLIINVQIIKDILMKSEVLSTVNQEFTWLSNNIDKIKVMIIQF